MLPRRRNRVEPPPERCPLNECLRFIGQAWTPNIIWYLSHQPRRFSELKADLAGISAKVLTARLRQLERDGLVRREELASSPPSVEYRLTALGQELKPAIEALVSVGHRLKLLTATPD